MKTYTAENCATCESSEWSVGRGDYCNFHKEKIPSKVSGDVFRLVCDDHSFRIKQNDDYEERR